MKVRLTKPFRVQLAAGTVVEVNNNYAATLKALSVAEIVQTKKPAKRKKAETKEEIEE